MEHFILRCKRCDSTDCEIYPQYDGKYVCLCKNCGQEEEN